MKNLTRSMLALLGLVVATIALATPATAQEPNFGRAIELAGDDLIIGQPVNWYGPGTVYTYRPDANGSWTEQSMLSAPDSSRMDDFGRALSLDGSTLAVAAPRKREGDVGVVYLFERASTGGAWSHSATIDPTGNADHREFGVALALSGDELLIGSPAVDGSGVVYHYERGAAGWTLAGTIAPSDDGATGFGMALDRAGDRVLIGAPQSSQGAGRAYVAERTATGWSAAEQTPQPQGLGQRDAFGASVLLTDGGGFIGGPGLGAVYALDMDDSGRWAISGGLRPFDQLGNSGFGASIDVADGALWVGAPNVDGDGRVYRFESDGSGGWREATRVDPDDTEGTSWPLGFGYAVAADGGRAVVGMPSRDFGEGRAMAFRASGDDWQAGEMLEGRIFRLGEGLETGDRCEAGEMSEFPCTNMELVAHVSIDDLGGERGVWVNDVWGWTDPDTGRRYALVARRDGASFLDVTDAAAPRLVGNLPRTEGSRPSVWRDIKTIGTHAFIVSDGAGAHGMQVFDLTRLRGVDEPVTFEPETTYHEIFSAHNVVADTASGFVYIVGAGDGGETCGGGLHMVDVRDPVNPTFAGCYTDDQASYTHDAQCVVYDGPDEDYVGRQICLGSNASELNIADVTDKSNPVTIARATYPNVSYAHQGWLDDEHRFFYQNDEGDETAGVVDRTRTMVWDLTELDDPILVTEYFGPVPASDHNLYVTGDLMYQSNYGSGLRVLDISDRGDPQEIAHFDSAPYNDNGPGFSSSESGAWSNYPFFEEGLVIFTSVREGLFIMRVTRPIT
jgi:choice-of-anchor B domain-containing protein